LVIGSALTNGGAMAGECLDLAILDMFALTTISNVLSGAIIGCVLGGLLGVGWSSSNSWWVLNIEGEGLLQRYRRFMTVFFGVVSQGFRRGSRVGPEEEVSDLVLTPVERLQAYGSDELAA